MTRVESPAIDGRRARRERGRVAVIDAMVDLVQEGHTPPTVEAVAERADVSVASLFRYFESLDDLQQQTASRFFEHYAPLFEVADIGVGPLDQRIRSYTRARIRLYETIAPIARLARARSLDHPHLAGTLGEMRQRLAEQARKHFGRELTGLTRTEQDDLVGSMITLTSFDAWDLLHHELGRSRAQIRRAWTSALTALCARR